MNKKEMNNKGFSLVELIIVIAIMAILVGVLAPQFIKFVEKSRESTDLQNVEEVKTAVETYVADHGEDISATSITVTCAPGGNISYGSDDSSVDLSEYGVDATKPAKSSKWSGDIEWTYNTGTYSWTLTDDTVAGDYYLATGENKPTT